MGHVFRGFDIKLPRALAFKVLSPELATATMAERFKREGERLAELHVVPNIVQVYDADETPDGLLYFVMEFVDGPTLQKVLEGGPLPLEQVRRIAAHLLAALEGAHELGITHRDIKPANVFLRGRQALLGDFGIASAADSDETTLTGPGHRIGTPAYMSPEQRLGFPVDARSDLFSMGLVLRECLTGKGPHEVGTGKDAWRGVPRHIRPVLMRALAESPDGRWPDAGAFRDAFEAAALAATRQRRRAAIGVPLTVIGASVAVVAGLLFGETVRAWLHVRVCRVVGLSDCAPPLRLADLAILPFVAPEGRDDRYNLAVQVSRHLEGTTRIKLAPWSQISDWWDSLPPRRRGTPPSFAHYYTDGTVNLVLPSALAAELALDSAGKTYESFRAAVDTGRMDSLAYSLADSVVCQGPFRRDCADFRSFRFRPTGDQVRAEFFAGKEAVQRGNWPAAEAHFLEALDRDSMFMPAAWELMIAKRIQRKDYVADLQFIARNIDSLPPFYRRLAMASLTPDLRERFRIFAEEVRRSRSGTAWLLYTNELFHRGALVGRSLQETVDTLTRLAATEPDMNHSSTYDMAWWGELRLGRERRAWQDLERRQALGPPPGDRYKDFQRLGTWARFSPWKAKLAHLLWFRSPSDMMLSSLADFARLGNLMDIPVEQLALGSILAEDGKDGRQRAAGLIGQAGGHLMLGQPGAAMARLDSASDVLNTPEMRLQQREWPVHLAALGLFFDTARVNSARAWLETTPLEGNARVRALYALGQDAMARGDTGRAAEVRGQLQALGAASPSARRHAALLGAELAGAGDPRAALDSSAVIYLRDTTLVRLSPFARLSTYLHRGNWQLGLGDPDAADREWLWYENSDFEGWPSGPPQEGELDAILSVYARMLRGELRAKRSDVAIACYHLKRVQELWADVEPAMLPMKERAERAARLAKCH